MAVSVHVGSSVHVTAGFTTALGGTASFNRVFWSYNSDDGGIVNITPDAPPAATANVAGVYPGTVTVIAWADTNPSVQPTIVITVIDTSTTPANGVITSP